MKKAIKKRQIRHGMLKEYDFRGGVRGKYAARLSRGSNVIVLDRDVAAAFPTSAAVNAALRRYERMQQAAQDSTRRARRRAG